MWIRNLDDCDEFRAGDDTRLRELIHPDKHPLAVRYSLAHAVLPPGQVSTPHALTTSEVYYVLSGRGEMHIGEESASIGSGDAVYIPPDAVQYVRNDGPDPLVFLCLVDPAWQPHSESVFPNQTTQSDGSQT